MKKYLFILMALLPLTLTAQAQAPGKTELSALLNSLAEEDSRYNLFEVGSEMLKAFCELENADSTSIAIFKKIKSVKMLELRRTEEELADLESEDPDNAFLDLTFYNDITTRLDLTNYNQLLKSRNNRSMALLLKKFFAPNDSEFLLITDHLVIDIRGDIVIKTIYQMEEVMSYVQQILPN